MHKNKNGKYAYWKDEQFKDYIPDVYCREITLIDYDKLWEAGIRFLSFDIDETIASSLDCKPSKTMIGHFAMLKSKGFKVVLLSNTSDWRVRYYAQKLEVDGISRANKPASGSFEKMMTTYSVGKEQMAHIGNSIVNDVCGGNVFGITTCMVRNVEYVIQKAKIPGHRSEGKKIRSEMKRRGLWYKHHVNEKGDQYYQLDEKPGYLKTAQGETV